MQLCRVSSDHDSQRVEIHAVLRGRALFVNKDANSNDKDLTFNQLT